MQYRHAGNRNYEDFASGRVIYTQAGQPAFPVRLASEIFQRCMARWQKRGGEGPCSLYDPTCGGAYWLVVLAYLHWEQIASISASDADAGVIPLAARNLSLLTAAGLERRIAELEAMWSAYGKASHAGALESARRFQQQLNQHLESHSIHTRVFQADGTAAGAIQQQLAGQKIDIVLADVPYGWHSSWQEKEGAATRSPVWSMLEALQPSLAPESIVAMAADKQQVLQHGNYQRLERFQVGRRQIALFGLSAS